jgi:hypothetical protein
MARSNSKANARTTARTTEELRGAMAQVQYEFNRMFLIGFLYSGHVRFALSQGDRPDALPLTEERFLDYASAAQDAWLEAFLIHVRNLIDFFIGPSRKGLDDIVAEDFFADPNTWARGVQRDGLDKVRARIGRKLAHLTYHRLVDRDGWNPRDLVERLLVLRNRFNALGPRFAFSLELGGKIDPQPGAASSSTIP